MAAMLRRLAYDLVARRDGRRGWQRHRRAFGALAEVSPREAEARSLDALRRILVHAYETVPFYRNAWNAIGFVPSPATTFADLARLPVVTKDDLRYRRGEMVSSAYDVRRLDVDLTGGTTGTQTSFYRDRACTTARFGRQWGILERCGFPPGERRALIWGAHADLPEHAPATFKQAFRRYAAGDEVLCCTTLTRADLRAYHARLSERTPHVIYGYPNAIEQFALCVRDEGLSPIRVRRVFCTAERLSDRQRRLFIDVFGGEVFNLYASREHGVAAFECRRHDALHVDSGSVHVEIVRSGRAARPGETGEIVITDLLNYGMPMIRHATADLAVAGRGVCPCGSPFPWLSRFEGRVADVLHRPDGSTVAGLMLTDLLADHRAIVEAQFVQTDRSSLDVYLVMSGSGDSLAGVQHEVARQVRSVVGPELTLRFHHVPSIARNPRSGKYQEVISRVSA